MKVKAVAISLPIAIAVMYFSYEGGKGCAQGLCIFEMIPSFLIALIVFILSVVIIYKIIKHNKEQEW